MPDDYRPRREDRFTFGLWTVGNRGRDPFGGEVREALSPVHIVERLAALGAFGVNFHDDDLVPFGSSAKQRDAIVAEFQRALSDHGLCVPMATVNLFTHPVFKDGAFTSNDARVRAYAIQKTLKAIDLGVECGARIFVLWGGREGVETDACRDPRDAISRMREALNFLTSYVVDQEYDLRFALEAKPNEPRSDIYFPTTGALLHFITTLDRADLVGVNPEVAHEQMSGLSFHHAVAQAIEAKKLFHIDLNDQKPGRYDQDLRFGSESIKGMFFLVNLLDSSGYEGPLHFDAHAYRSEDEEGVWDFARGCMRTFKILRAKAARFREDPDVQSLLREAVVEDAELTSLMAKYSSRGAVALKERSFDVSALSRRGLRYERLDQLVTELLLGVR